jgi:arginine deiminase
MNIEVTSETGRLKAVIVHTPGREISLVNPEIKHTLLFDDIIFEDDARREHLDMIRLIEAGMPEGGVVYEIVDLIRECFSSEDARYHFIHNLIRTLPDEHLHPIEGELKKLDPEELIRFGIEGRTPSLRNFILPPSPNLLFTRDLAAFIGRSVVLSRAAHEARLRESLLTETMIAYHPLFSGVRDHTIRIAPGDSIEGGDILVLSDKIVLIGMSERTSFSGLMNASAQLLRKGVEHVLIADIPKQRSSMHLDTIFTFCSENECVAYPPAIMARKNNVVHLRLENDFIRTEMKESLKSAIEELTGREYTFVKCGGEELTNQQREQWSDGANVFALAPGLIIGYERNTNTFTALGEQGYRIMDQFEFIDAYRDRRYEPGKDPKTAVHFRGHELCRGRGGARCMTMPISRDQQVTH